MLLTKNFKQQKSTWIDMMVLTLDLEVCFCQRCHIWFSWGQF